MPRQIYLSATLSVLFLLISWGPVFSQKNEPVDTASHIIVYTTDGNEFVGKIRSENADAIVLHTELLGDLTIQRSAIRRMHAMYTAKMVKGRFWFENRHAPRYFVGPSAYGLRKGEGVFENSELFLCQTSYGISDRFSVGVGFAPFFIFWDGPFPAWVTPKLSFPIKEDKLNLAIGGIFGRSLNDQTDGNPSDNGTFGAVYSVLTVGSRDANLSVGFGFWAEDNYWASKPMITVAGTVRLAANIALLGEGYFYNTEFERIRLFGGGIRFMGRGIALDAGVAVMAYQYDGAQPIPYGTLHIPFGRPKN